MLLPETKHTKWMADQLTMNGNDITEMSIENRALQGLYFYAFSIQ